MADVQLAVINQQPTQLALVSGEEAQNAQLALAAPDETQIVVAVPGLQGAIGQGVPSGGTTGQLLAKASNADYDTEWVIANPLPLPSFTQVDLTYSGNTIIAA